jgi:hypothetical protein
MRLRNAAAVLLIAGSAAAEAGDTYVFDTLSRVDMHINNPSVTGILENTTTPVTVTIPDSVSSSFRDAFNRCVPLFLTMLEKPGRYRLHLTVEPTLNIGIANCALELRN